MRLIVHLATSLRRMAEPMLAVSAVLAPLEKAAATNEPALTLYGDVCLLQHLQNSRMRNAFREAPAECKTDSARAGRSLLLGCASARTGVG